MVKNCRGTNSEGAAEEEPEQDKDIYKENNAQPR